MSRKLLATIFVVVAACTKANAPSGRIDIDDTAQCEPCHADITREWRESMHAVAHRGDPIYEGVLALRSKKEGAGLEEKCTPCHQPRAGKTAGVSCAACHNVASLAASGNGAKRFVPAAADLLLGPHELPADKTPVHQTGAAARHLADGASLCLACHDSLDNAAKISLCATGIEWRAGGPSAATCTSCHMPRAPGAATVATTRADHADHRFLGPARLYRSEDGKRPSGMVELTIEGDPPIVKIKTFTSHAFPTGFPGRIAELSIRGFDSAGKEVWTSSAAFAKTFFDEANRPVMGPYGVSSKDTRIEPAGERTFPVTSEHELVRIEAVLSERLLGPQLAKAIGLEGTKHAEPKIVAHRTFIRDQR
jgi:hypothetical protein